MTNIATIDEYRTLMKQARRHLNRALQVRVIPCFTDKEQDFVQHDVDTTRDLLDLIEQKHINQDPNIDINQEGK